MMEAYERAKARAESEVKEFCEYLKKVSETPLIKKLREYPEGKESVDKLMQLYQFGVQRIFHTAYWGEFRDIRYFMLHFLQRLLGYEKYAPEKLEEIAGQAAGSIDLFNENISVVLHERLLLGIGMRENVHDGIYKTGAYEELIQLYRIWIREIREIYYRVAGWKNSAEGCYAKMFFHALFVPSEEKDILSWELFDTCGVKVEEKPDGKTELTQKQTLVLFQMGTENLWTFKSSFIYLTHEVGHYLFVYKEPERCELFLEMLGVYFTHSLEEFLVGIYNPWLPLGIVPDLRDKVAKSLTAFLKQAAHKEFAKCFQESGEAFDSLIDRWFPVDFSYYRDLPENDKGRDFADSIEEYLDAYDFYALFWPDSILLSTQLKYTFETARRICRNLICETCADFLPRKLLGLNSSQMAESILQEQIKLNEMQEQQAPTDAEFYLLAIRLLCVFLISEEGAADKEAAVRELQEWMHRQLPCDEKEENSWPPSLNGKLGNCIVQLSYYKGEPYILKWQKMLDLLLCEKGYMWESFRNIDPQGAEERTNALVELFKSSDGQYDLMTLMDFTHKHTPYDHREADNGSRE